VRKRHSPARFASCCSAALAFALAACDSPVEPVQTFTLAVLDVGQGLSQAAIRDERAIMFDMGPLGESARWRDGYRGLGSPPIAAIVISHSDSDHVSGLAGLDTTAAFGGTLYISPLEDTARILAQSGAWASRVRFRRVAQGDTVGGLDGVRAECLWPPRVTGPALPLSGEERNRYSLVFLLTHGACRALLTGDIDTVALDSLAFTYGWGLQAQILVAPHHGSAGGVHRVFYGYVRPSVVVISCSAHNSYGHPAAAVVDLIFEMGCEMLTTYGSGHLRAESQGCYWNWGGE
jgi:competence protein ComEC